MKKKETYIQSSNGRDKLHVIVWEPSEKPKAILQISHGMIELMERYDDFARYLCEEGFVVAGNDHLGHGLTAADEDDLGYMHSYDASKTMVADLHRLTVCLKKAYKDIPFFLMGHSMGSFLARRYMSEYGYDYLRPSKFNDKRSVDGFICMGTGSIPDPVLKSAHILATAEKKRKGERYRSELINKVAFGAYNNGIPKTTGEGENLRERTEKDWLTRDTEKVAEYLSNPYCTYTFTVKGYETLFNTLDFIQRKENVQRIPKNVPVLFISGDKDPVGHYGKDVYKLSSMYENKVSNDVTTILYHEARHEVLNEINRDEVYNDIKEWLLDRVDACR